MHNPKLSKKFFIPLLFLICFLTFLVVRTLTYSYFINRRFRACTNTIFTTDISSNPLNLHYTLAYPESAGIKDYSLSLGSFDPTQLSAQKILLENRRNLINILRSLPCAQLIASHDLDFIYAACDRVILLHDGQIAADGAVKDVLRNQELLEACNLELPLMFQQAD